DPTRHVGHPRHPIIDDVRVHQLRPVIDELLVQCSSEALHRSSEILRFDGLRIDRPAHIRDGRELVDLDVPRLGVDLQAYTDDTNLPEGVHLLWLALPTDNPKAGHFADRSPEPPLEDLMKRYVFT